MPERAKQARRTALILAVSSGCVVVFIGLFLFFAKKASDENRSIRSELRAAVTRLNAANEQTAQTVYNGCVYRRAVVVQGNEQVRKPLRQMLSYVAQLVDQGVKQARAQGKPVTKQTLEIETRFSAFSAQVKDVVPQDCGAPPSGN